jgi:hypothetical protein
MFVTQMLLHRILVGATLVVALPHNDDDLSRG